MTRNFYTTIGLEIHVELQTESKMFCRCKNDADETTANKNICSICLAHPGTLPMPNRKAVEQVIKVGLALGGKIADYSEFDRKNYFYPDIPKNYQISQFKYPIVSGGELSGVALTRIHLEEDTATSKHEQAGYSLVDFNRAGVPLMEIVTEPVIHDSKTAGNFGRELQLLLRYLEVSEANMEKGQLRAELNISISPNKEILGTKVEIKNINSFRALERGAEFEIARMGKLWEEGREAEIVQETRGWDDARGLTFSQRAKESSHDYRYFPDPDISKMQIWQEFNLDNLKLNLPELPEAKRLRYEKKFGIKSEDIESYITDISLGQYFEEIVSILETRKSLDDNTDGNEKNEKSGADISELVRIASNYITSDLLGILKTNKEANKPPGEYMATLVLLIAAGSLSSRGAKDVLLIMATTGREPMQIVEERGLLQKNDAAELTNIIAAVIADNEKIVADYRTGKESALQALVGGVMKVTKGSANPKLTAELLIKALKK